MLRCGAEVYESRLSREEGGQLWRLRWYGEPESVGRDSEVFVERKTHHEVWTNESSVKERFAMKAKYCPGYFGGGGEVGLSSVCKRLQKKMQAQRADHSDIGASLKLATEVSEALRERRLEPSVLTTYKRTAFQLSSSNDLRISVDTDLEERSSRRLDIARAPAPFA